MNQSRRLFEQLEGLGNSRTVILGIGSTLKGDDAVGPLACEGLAGKVCAEVIDAGAVPENYIQPIIRKNPQTLLIIDAMDFGAAAGTINVFRPDQLGSAAISTHTLSPRLFVDMIRRDIEVDVYFVGVQPGQTELGRALSPPVEQALQQVIQTLAEVFVDKAGL
jgi:hydrogenase 3 maturation protease